MRVICVDWSGAVTGAERTIWLAEVREGTVVRLENGRSRDAIAAHLIDESRRDPHLLIGFDFAFSFPAWFVRDQGCDSAPAMWDLAARNGERWLQACVSPFWGRPGIKRPELPAHFRVADRAIPAVGGIRPKSVFQIGGAGAVGTGSIRGMPLLSRLRAAGIAIWPFDAATLPAAFEIYPRALTGAVAKRDPESRCRYLAREYPMLDPAVRRPAERSEDAFDALVSALVLSRHATAFIGMPACTDESSRLEGAIWTPECAAVPKS